MQKGSAVHIFVYGTLMRGYDNQFAETLHTYAEFVSVASTGGLLYQVTHYPAAIFNGDKIIHGEIFRIFDSTILESLDDYEGYYGANNPSNYYNRVEILIDSPKGIFNCLTYEYAKPTLGLKLITDGRFKG